MPNEIFAEDIETLLERLEGVAAARVVANDAGEIDAIHVTAAGDRDEAKLRRMVTSALMSRYSLAVDGWRIRVARLRSEEPSTRWFLHRVEEQLTTTSVRVTVELQTEDGRGTILVGHAHGLPDRTNRRRSVVLAALDALRTVLDGEERRAALEAISTVPLVGGEAIVVAVSISSPSQSSLYVGSSVIEGNEADALINATLDAIAKRGARLPRRGWVMKDRRDQLESMRVHYRRLREPQRQMPALSKVEPGAEGPAPPALSEAGPEPRLPRAASGRGGVKGSEIEESVLEESPVDAGPEPSRRGPMIARAGLPTPSPDVDGVSEMPDDGAAQRAQIRPERQGGAAVATADVNRQEVGKPGSKSAMDDDFFRHLIATGMPVHIRCRDGYEIADAVLKDVGTYTLLVESDGGRELIFKHGIISIRPLTANKLKG